MFYILAGASLLWGLKLRTSDAGYMKKENINGIKGFLALLIFLSHSYMSMLSLGVKLTGVEILAWRIRNLLGQLIVAVLLFYSGYGVMVSVMRKKKTYLGQMWKRRIFKTWVHFAFAVLLFFLFNIVTNQTYPVNIIIGAFFAWTKIGNANWYIFCVLILYILSWLAFSIVLSINSLGQRLQLSFGVAILFCMVCCYISIMASIRPIDQTYWYDTALCYPLGALFALNQEKFDKVIVCNNKNYYFSVLVVFVITGLVYKCQRMVPAITYNLWSCVICMLTVMLSVKFHVGNRFLYWWNDHIFSTYITRALASQIIIICLNDVLTLKTSLCFYLYMFAVGLLTAILSLIFDYWTTKLDQILLL